MFHSIFLGSQISDLISDLTALHLYKLENQYNDCTFMYNTETKELELGLGLLWISSKAVAC